MSGKIQFDDEFNYRPQNTTRASYSRTPKKTRTTLTQRLVRNGICKNTKSAENLLLIIALISFTAGIFFTTLILNPAIKYKFIFTMEGKKILTGHEAGEFIEQNFFNNTDNIHLDNK